MKRALDLTVSLIALAVLSPLLVVIAVFIKLEDGGPVFYRGVRAGRHGRPFRMYKFRTMVVNADSIGPPSTADDDPRITRIGRVLRRYKLDELPQLLNVVMAEMSLVGPRPEVLDEVRLYTDEERLLLSVRPGITDFASLRFNREGEILRGSPDPHRTYREKIRPDKMRLGLEYVRRRSLWIDLAILARTALMPLGLGRTWTAADPSRVMGDMPSRYAEYRALATRIRRHVITMTHRSKASHVGSSLSMADILAVLYAGVLLVDPARPARPDRDRFILSKGHGCAGVYAVLAERGFFPVAWLERFYQDGSPLVGHLTHGGVPGVEVSTGSLGHGLSIACGMALAAKRDGKAYRVFVLLSDGECDEGSTWEAALFAPHHGLDNLVAIVDYNKIQSLGTVKEVLDLEPLAAKWEAFGWAAVEVDGHDLGQIERALARVPIRPGRPTCVVAHTVKGKGVRFMEDRLLWHYRSPSEDDVARALAELEGAE